MSRKTCGPDVEAGKPHVRAVSNVPVVVRGDARALPLPDESVDAIVCDPPYELSFMSRTWDSTGVAFDTRPWEEALRVLKPGGHVAAFGAPRTYHRLTCAIESAGFEIRDGIAAWLYGSGMPKSKRHLKPAYEPILLARKPFRGSEVACIAKHGTGGINPELCRIPHGADVDLTRQQNQHAETAGMNGLGRSGFKADHSQPLYAEGGRWPTNVVLCHHPECEDSSCTTGPTGRSTTASTRDTSANLSSGAALNAVRNTVQNDRNVDSDSELHELVIRCAPECEVAALDAQSDFFPRFHYEAKAPSWQRPQLSDGSRFETVKPLDLMRWLVRLLTPPQGRVLDMFSGTGTTGQAAQLEGFASVLVEKERRHIEFIRRRLAQSVIVDQATGKTKLVTERIDHGQASLFDEEAS